MTSKKDFLIGLGERTQTPGTTDELLAGAVSKRKRKEIEREEDISAAKHKADMAKYGKETATSEAAVEKTGGGGGGYQVKGEINLGSINLQEEREKATAETERLRLELKASANKTSEENAQLRRDVHTAEMKEIKANNDAAIAAMASKFDSRSPVEVIADIRTMAAELGLKAPDPSIGEPGLQLQILQLTNAEAARAREFEWQMEQDRNAREDRKDARKDDLAMRGAELALTRDRNEMLAKAPETIGKVIVMGMAANAEGGQEDSQAPSKSKTRPITAGVGESGEVECPQCGKPVAVGPTARKAVCAGCKAQYSIQRVSSPAAQPRSEEPPGSEEE